MKWSSAAPSKGAIGPLCILECGKESREEAKLLQHELHSCRRWRGISLIRRIAEFAAILQLAWHSGVGDAWEVPGIWNRHVDMAIGGIGRASWRESPTVEWSMPYFALKRTVVFRLSDPILKFPDDLTGIVAGTMGSTGIADAMRRMKKKFGQKWYEHIDVRWKTSDAIDLRDLRDGKIQGLMRGSFVGKAIVKQHEKELGMATPWDAEPSPEDPYGAEVFVFPCRRGSGLAAQMNIYLMKLSQSGELKRLCELHGMT